MKSSTLRRHLKPILAGAFIFYIFSGVSSVLNYAFYPAISRFVSVSEYGEIQFLVSMFAQLAVGFVVLNILAIIIGAEIKDAARQQKILRGLTIIASAVSGVIVTIGGIVLLTQSEQLGISSPLSVLALALSLLFNVPFTIAIGKLQGNNQFMASGVIGILGALLKLVFSVLFVLLGFGVAGAIFGIAIGLIVSLLLVEIANRRTSPAVDPSKKVTFKKSDLALLSFIKNRSIVALVAVTFITLLSTADSITSRIVLDTTDAGHYASVATVAKMILAGTSPLMWLALPPALQRNTKVVTKYLFATLGVSLIASVCFIAAPLFFTETIVGVHPEQFVSLMPLAAISLTLCALAFITLTAAICMERLRSVILGITLSFISYVVVAMIVTPGAGAILGSLYGQAAASACLVLALLPGIVFQKSR